MIVTYRTNIAALVIALGAFAAPSAAQATSTCPDVPNDGACIDSATFAWCVNGEVRQLTCSDGEVCVAHANYDGGQGCIATQLTDCGDVSVAGRCTEDAREVEWCQRGDVKVRECDPGTTCAWVSDEGWYDCVGDGELTTNTPKEADPDDVTEPGTEPTPAPSDMAGAPAEALERNDNAPLPDVGQGGAGASSDFLAGGGGADCSGGGGDGPLVWLALLGVVSLARTRRLSDI